jgi:hypothetical protein
VIFSPGVVRELFFDAQSHFMVRDVIPAHGDCAAIEFDYSDYCAVQGVLESFAIAQSHGADALRATITTVMLNAPVGDSIFQFPGASRPRL